MELEMKEPRNMNELRKFVKDKQEMNESELGRNKRSDWK